MEIIATETMTKWFINGTLHRIDGPAVETIYGDREYHLGGKCYYKERNNKVRKNTKSRKNKS